MEKGLELGSAELRALYRTPTLDGASFNGSAHQEAEADRRQAGKAIVAAGAAALFSRQAVERILHHGTGRWMPSSSPRMRTLLTRLGNARGRTARCAGRPGRPSCQRAAVAVGPASDGGGAAACSAIAVGSFAQAGLLAFVLQDRLAAHRWFALARTTADDSADPTLRAQALGIASILPAEPTADGRAGDAARAAGLLTRAAGHARHADAATREWVHAWLASELAATGDERGFRQAVEVAERNAEPHGHTDGRGFFARYMNVGGSRETLRNTGIGLVRLGRGDDAVGALSAALALPSAGGPRVTLLINSTVARLLVDEP